MWAGNGSLKLSFIMDPLTEGGRSRIRLVFFLGLGILGLLTGGARPASLRRRASSGRVGRQRTSNSYPCDSHPSSHKGDCIALDRRTARGHCRRWSVEPSSGCLWTMYVVIEHVPAVAPKRTGLSSGPPSFPPVSPRSARRLSGMCAAGLVGSRRSGWVAFVALALLGCHGVRSTGFGGGLIMLGLIALVTGVYVLATRRVQQTRGSGHEGGDGAADIGDPSPPGSTHPRLTGTQPGEITPSAHSHRTSAEGSSVNPARPARRTIALVLGA